MDDEVRRHHGLLPMKRFDDLGDVLSMNLMASPEEQKQIRLRETATLTSRIVELLGSLPQAGSDNSNAEMALYLRYTTKELPPFPAQWSREGLVEYLAKATQALHMTSESGRSPGLLAQIVKDLLRYNNRSTSGCLSLEAFNIAIAYLVRISDIRGARQLLRDMGPAGIARSSQTYNLILLAARHRLRDPRSKWVVHPLISVVKSLEAMSRDNIAATPETWNIVLAGMPDGTSKSAVMTEMTKRDIQLSSRGLAACVHDMLEELGPAAVAVYLEKQGDKHDVGVDVVNTVLSGFANDKSFDLAWDYLQYAVNKWRIVPTTSTLNTLARVLAEQGRVDLIIGLYAGMKEKWNVKLDIRTFKEMLRAVCLAGFNENTVNVMQILQCQHRDWHSSPSVSYWRKWALDQQYYFQCLAEKRQPSVDERLGQPAATWPRHLSLEQDLLWTTATELLKWDSSARLVYDEGSKESHIVNLLGVPYSQQKRISDTKADEGDTLSSEPLDSRFPRLPTSFFKKLNRKRSAERKRKVIREQQDILTKQPYMAYVEQLMKHNIINSK